MANPKELTPFAAAFRERRLHLGLTQQALASKTQISLRTIVAIERAEYLPGPKVAYFIAPTMGLRADSLLEGRVVVPRGAK